MATRLRSGLTMMVTVTALACIWVDSAQAQATAVSVAFRGGVEPSPAGTRAVVSGAVSVPLSSRLEVEAEAAWFTERRWSSVFSVTGGLRVALGGTVWSDEVVPFVSGGGGYHRARVSLADPRLLGPVPAGAQPGDRYCPGRGAGAGAGNPVASDCMADQTWGVGDLPDFYARQLGTLVVPPARVWPDRVFDDAVMTFGGGLRIRTGRGLFVQPEAKLWLVFAGSRTRASGVAGVAIGYGF